MRLGRGCSVHASARAAKRVLLQSKKPMKFADLGLSDELLAAVTAKGYDTPTPIQAQAIPSVLMMRDIIGVARKPAPARPAASCCR